jgi:hypothetical protein
MVSCATGEKTIEVPMSNHSHNVKSFARNLALLLMVRRAVQWTTLWFFAWGVISLAIRLSRTGHHAWLPLGLLGCLPLAVAAAVREWRQRVAFNKLRAAYDGLNRCGGVIMAEETTDMSAWQNTLPQPALPVLRWRGRRAFGLFTVAAAFVAIALCLPDRLAAIAAPKPLEVGKLVGELKTEVETLKDEKILEDKKAEDLQKQLSRLREQSSALDPNKTWEALDHIKEANADLAHQAAEEAVAKTSSLSEAQTLANALQQAADAGLNPETATRAAQDLAGMLNAARLADGLMDAKLPPELLAQLSKMDPGTLKKLLQAIQANKNNLSGAISNLANLRMIDPKYLSQCQNAGQCKNPNALAEYLGQCNGTNACNFGVLAQAYSRNIKPGGGTAPMSWKDESSDQNVKFKEDVLPPANNFSDAQMVGVSRAAPQLTDESTDVSHGALAAAQAGGGAANSQVILPRHKQAVQRYFKRE